MYALAEDMPVAARALPGRTWRRECAECGLEFRAEKPHAEFCCAEHRKAFNNRRMTRGAVVYDLFMALRYERKAAQKLRTWFMLCRLAMDFRREDRNERDGRKSWRDPRDVLTERPYLHNVLMSDKTWRRSH